MQRTVRLLKGSALQVFRDQMLAVLLIAPIFMGIALRFLIPLADRLLLQYLGFTLKPYYLLADVVTLTVGAMVIGMMTGLLMLDERDDGISAYFAVTPVGGPAYLVSRLVLPFVYYGTAELLIMSFAALGNTGYLLMTAPVLISALCGIFMAMLLVSVASNKLEGLAVSKLQGIILCGIPLAWFAAYPWKLIGMVLPTYWVTEILIQAKAGNIPGYLAASAAGLACSSLWIWGLYRLFIRRLQ